MKKPNGKRINYYETDKVAKFMAKYVNNNEYSAWIRQATHEQMLWQIEIGRKGDVVELSTESKKKD